MRIWVSGLVCRLFGAALICYLGTTDGLAAELRIQSLDAAGTMSVSGVFTNGVCTLERASDIGGPWHPLKNVFTTNETVGLTVSHGGLNSFYRALAVDLADSSTGYANLTRSYGLLTTIAGAGGATDDSNKWQTEFENGPATNALLSGPHIAMADKAGNVYIADKNAHAVRRVLPDGRIVTAAGVNTSGNAPDEPTPAAQAALSQPNGLWVRADGTVYILDLGNGKVRRLDTNQMLQTLFAVPGGILAGRGLWVKDDESVAFVASLTTVKKWTPSEGLTDYATGFQELANLVVDPWGRLVVTDRSTHTVWRALDDGTKVPIAGNGTQSTVSPGGGDGGLAILTPLDGVRGVWFLPTGAFFVCTHRGSQIWHVDTDGLIRLFLNGHRSETHAGDGSWFWAPGEFRVSECRAITADFDGSLLIAEHDAGYVRKIQFLRLPGP